MNGHSEWWKVQDTKSQLAARTIQRHWRKYIIKKKKLQENALAKSHCFCPLCYFKKLTKKYRISILNRCATIIQASWLGYATRKVQHKNRNLRTVFRRLMVANSRVTEEMKLGYKFEYSSSRILRNRNFTIEPELIAIETSTRMSPECCIRAASQGVVRVIVAILNESNRSEAHKLRVTCSVAILVNIYKFHRCLEYLKNGESVASVCIKIMKIHQRSDQIFLKCVTLLALLTRSRSLRELIIKEKTNRFTISSIAQSNSLQEGKTTEMNKLIKDISYNFVPYWCLRRGSIQQFTARSHALIFLSHLLDHL